VSDVFQFSPVGKIRRQRRSPLLQISIAQIITIKVQFQVVKYHQRNWYVFSFPGEAKIFLHKLLKKAFEVAKKGKRRDKQRMIIAKAS